MLAVLNSLIIQKNSYIGVDLDLLNVKDLRLINNVTNKYCISCACIYVYIWETMD